jgi:hypothetical protein
MPFYDYAVVPSARLRSVFRSFGGDESGNKSKLRNSVLKSAVQLGSCLFAVFVLVLVGCGWIKDCELQGNKHADHRTIYPFQQEAMNKCV